MRTGMKFRMNGQTWVVEYVNTSRAHCVSTTSEDVLDISPNAIVEAL